MTVVACTGFAFRNSLDPKVHSIVTTKIDVIKRAAAAERVIREIQDVVRLMVRHVVPQQLQLRIDSLGKPQPPQQPMDGAARRTLLRALSQMSQNGCLWHSRPAHRHCTAPRMPAAPQFFASLHPDLAVDYRSPEKPSPSRMWLALRPGLRAFRHSYAFALKIDAWFRSRAAIGRSNEQ